MREYYYIDEEIVNPETNRILPKGFVLEIYRNKTATITVEVGEKTVYFEKIKLRYTESFSATYHNGSNIYITDGAVIGKEESTYNGISELQKTIREIDRELEALKDKMFLESINLQKGQYFINNIKKMREELISS